MQTHTLLLADEEAGAQRETQKRSSWIHTHGRQTWEWLVQTSATRWEVALSEQNSSNLWGTIFSRGFTDTKICTVSEPHSAAYLPLQVAFAKNKTENQESHVFQMCVWWNCIVTGDLQRVSQCWGVKGEGVTYPGNSSHSLSPISPACLACEDLCWWHLNERSRASEPPSPRLWNPELASSPASLPLAYPRVHPTLCFLPNYSKLFRHFMAQPRYHTHLSQQRWRRRRKCYVRRPGFCPRTLGVRLAPQNRASQSFSSRGTFRK